MRHRHTSVAVAYIAFVLVGISAGVNGVLLVAQMDDYGVSRATIGITFFTGSAGFVLAGATAGWLIHRYGTRLALAVGGTAYVLAALYTATRPPFVAFVVLQVATGYAMGTLESVLNAYLAALPNATTLLNRLHGFFGVGALIGPPLATWITGFNTWPAVWLALALVAAPITVGFLATYPRHGDDPTKQEQTTRERWLRTTLRQWGVLLGAILLAVYVGLEIGVGNWGFSYLVEARDQGEVLAGYGVSGYWLGLTAGRFLLSPIVTRLGLTAVGLMYTCLVGVTAAALFTWLLPGTGPAVVGLVLLGFFLGPIFPTAMAVVPRVTSARLVPSAIGVMNAGSVVGGSALPWLAGVVAQRAGVWTLLPFTLVLALLQLAVWWPMARLVKARRAPVSQPVHAETLA
ncbi:MFS transporter [Phytohabitans kaempferiae]|uniref:Sugar MFS transporter n=1 Tax=Phytohabitans kaempferiae TaxID=1620943 RepID=A0ABV6MFJ9_9ACTN